MAKLDDTDLEALNALGLPNHLMLAVFQGEITPAEALARGDFDRRVHNLRRTPKAKWPAPEILWDLAPENWHMALDGYSTEAFSRDYPDVIVG